MLKKLKLKKQTKILISICFISLFIFSYLLIIIFKSNEKESFNTPVSGLAVYVGYKGNYTANSSIPTGDYTFNTTLSHCVGGSSIGNYSSSNGTIDYALNGADWCYLYFDIVLPKISEKVIALSSNNTANITNNIAVDAHTDSSDNSTYYEYRYVGANPNNYACFSSNGTDCINYTKGSSSSTNTTGGLFRIIGVFNEDTHGQEDEQLVKLISADSIGSMPWDYKNGSTSAATSSSISTYGSNDWSDSQLMYMLNGSDGNNKGYQSLTPVYGTTTPIRTLTYSSNNVYYNSTNYFYTNYSGYSYLSGSTTSSRTLNKPASVANGSNYSSSTLSVNSLVPIQTSMIKEVIWHLGGYSSGSILTSAFYTYERGSTVYSTSTTRPYTWIGKIGLMYPSDYGYATSGGTTYNRNACLTSYSLGSWNSYSDCYTNDWLLYPKARTGTQGTKTSQWTISPYSSNANVVFIVSSSGYVFDYDARYSSYAARPAFYLESEVSVAAGDGTSTTPYLLTSDIDGKPEILNIENTNVDYKLTAVAIDDNGLAGYALSTSNSAAPTSWTSISGTTSSITAIASTSGNYYLWVKDSSGQTTVTTDSYYLAYDSIKPTISNGSTSGRTLTATLADNKALSGYALSTSNSTTPTSWTSISGTSYSLSYTASSNVIYYLWVKDSSGNTNVTTSNYGLYTFSSTNLVSRMQELVTLDPNAASDTQGSYTNYRYIGANPNNYACFDDGDGGCINYSKDNATNKPAGLFRIIGVFNSDTHGVTDTSGQSVPLVKLISADKLGNTNIIWDYKQSGVGSSTSNGSNDWSDSQLMYMLNGFVNAGYNASGTLLHTGYSYNSSTYYINDGTYNIYQLNNGNSYLTGAGATTLNVPASTTTSGYTASTNTNMQTLTSPQANMIATVTWKLGGTASFESSSNGLASHFYNYERGITSYAVYSGRPTTWTGKIGLMYPSDYGYATSGGSTCANKELYNWDGSSTCYTNDWLLYPGARTGTQGTASNQWTVSPHSSYAHRVFYVYSSGFVSSFYASLSNYAARPAFYLESSVYVAGGSGTSTDPYLLAMD